jgi:hypothetical protein
MTREKLRLWSVAVLLIAGAAGVLAYLRGHQTLGAPGLKTSPIPDSVRLQVDLPQLVGGDTSEAMETTKLVLATLPPDTSFGHRKYISPDRSFRPELSVVLMGRDRSSIHKPQYCLEGDGWRIDQAKTVVTTVPVHRPISYDLPVVKLIATKEFILGGRRALYRGIFVYWFVADGELSASVSGFERMWKMSRRLLRTGVWQRWAYVTCGAACQPGQEDATFEKLKEFIAEAAPEFQLTPRQSPQAITSR